MKFGEILLIFLSVHIMKAIVSMLWTIVDGDQPTNQLLEIMLTVWTIYCYKVQAVIVCFVN